MKHHSHIVALPSNVPLNRLATKVTRNIIYIRLYEEGLCLSSRTTNKLCQTSPNYGLLSLGNWIKLRALTLYESLRGERRIYGLRAN
jgi:hypothetical protein